MVIIAALAVSSVLQLPTPQLRSDWAAVLPADYWPSNMHGWCGREAPGRSGYWVPDTDTIRSLEAALVPELDRALGGKASDYYRQYIGIRIGRRQVVYINGFHRSHAERLAITHPHLANEWRTRAVNVCDGGSMFFGAEFDPATQRISNLRFNGPGEPAARHDDGSH